MAKLMFQQRRARQCASIMLQPPWHIANYVHTLPTRYRGFVLLLTFASFLLYMLLISGNVPGVLSGVSLVLLVQLLQVLLLVKVADVADRNDYLWVGYRADYADDFLYEGDEQEIKHLRQELAGMRNSTFSELVEIKQEL